MSFVSKLSHFHKVGLLSTTLLVAGIATVNSAKAAGKKSIETIRLANSEVSLNNKRAVVVGGTNGIGEGIAMRLAKANVSVTIVGRSQSRGEEVVKKLTTIGGTNHDFVSCDSFSMGNVVDASKEIKSRYEGKLDYLVFTQGMATTQGRTETKEGIDQKFALHYFSRMLFTKELLPLLRQTAANDDADNNPAHSGKVLSVFSAGVHKPYLSYKDDFELKKNYTLSDAANACGFYGDLGWDAFSRQAGNEKVAFIHAAPGMVSSNWGTELPWYFKYTVRLLQALLARSIEDCGEVMCDPLFNHKAGGLVMINENGNPTKLTDAHSDEARDIVFQNTMQVLANVLKKE